MKSARRPPALLVLADGTTFEGEAIGASATGALPIASGEVVFNTAIAGYQEIITDPSYAGQVITFTYPHIGNYGVSEADNESAKSHCRGVIVRHLPHRPSSWRAEGDIESFLVAAGVGGLCGVDTRRLTRHIRDAGAMPCAYGTVDYAGLLARARLEPGTLGQDLVDEVTTATAYRRPGGPYNVVAYDLGIKRAILDQLAQIAAVEVVPARTTAAEVLARRPDGVFLSNGPGDPAALGHIVAEVRSLLGAVPIFGVCLGHQLLASALGGSTYKLAFGHHGANHPVRRVATGTVEIACENHGYAVVEGSVAQASVTHVNLNDDVLEGLASDEHEAFSVQYHPEAGPGPHDARYLFGEFAALMQTRRSRRSRLMPKRDDLDSVLVIGSGPIVIGQACEFDYSGTQACRALVEEGLRVILVNSNPATIMTDPEVADRTYIEPLDVDVVAAIIERERPRALLPTMGGQTALNLAMQLSRSGVLDTFGVELIGASAEAIDTAEDREQFKKAMTEIGLEVPASGFAHTLEEALVVGTEIGFPAMVRPSFILGGGGTGIANSRQELETLAAAGLAASPISQILVERSIAGWKEFELEVMRDRLDNCVVICSIENFDPMGVHTGDSITVAPAQTLSDVEYQKMRDDAFACIRRVGVETGGSNIQFAVDPTNGQQLVIEMNPRVSRSSALASKATGFPIAKIAARLALGYTLDEIRNEITKATPASFEPTIDYVVTKVPRWAFEKLPGVPDRLGTRMQSVGEVMAIGRTFAESFQKALRGLEQGRLGLNCDPGEESLDAVPIDELLARAAQPTPQRPFEVEAALRRGATVETVSSRTGIDPWFLDRIAEISEGRDMLDSIVGAPDALSSLEKSDWRHLKRLGFSDAQIAWRLDVDESSARQARRLHGVEVTFKTVDTCGAEFAAETPYYYSTFEDEDEVRPAARPCVVILGSGPNRIGQGIEFDYCCVHASLALRAAGFETVMVNCNPETVSTDFDTSDRLYFEPITEEDVLAVVDAEQHAGAGGVVGVIVTLGGQTPLKLAARLPESLVLGTSPSSIDLAEDRQRFGELLDQLGIAQPSGGTARSADEARQVAARVGYPVLVRPSYVLGGRAMEIVYDDAGLEEAMAVLVGMGSLGREGGLSATRPVLIDSFLEDAIEVDVDAVRDSTGEVLIGGVMEHVEEAGVHSGDSACAIPPQTLDDEIVKRLEDDTRRIAEALSVVGPLNVQFAVKAGDVYVIEANPRASRTVPFVAKATGLPLAKVAARVIVGATLAELRAEGLIDERVLSKERAVSVKEAVLPFDRFPEVDSLLGPEMRSTGEVMGTAQSFGLAFAKSQLAAGNRLPDSGEVFFSLADRDKAAGLEVAEEFVRLGFAVAATDGTASFLEAHGVPIEQVVAKIGFPSTRAFELADAVELIGGGTIVLVVNTPSGRGARADGAYIRRAASANGVPILTTVRAALAAARGISEARLAGMTVMSLQERHGALR